jgi:AAA+ superfamily predicted ATPase
VAAPPSRLAPEGSLSDGARIDALRDALRLTPENDGLRLLLAEMLVDAGRAEEAVDEYETLHTRRALPADELVPAAELAVRAGRLATAETLLDAARNAGVVEGVADVQAEVDRVRADDPERIRLPLGFGEGEEDVAALPMLGELEARETVTFAEIGGLDDVKKAIHRTIILPYQRPDLYLKYGRGAGGGVLLYGPPGCGKTMLARATAGECGLPFLNVRIEEILDPYFGVSERNLHAAFELARASAPCVLFLDELDAVAYARRKVTGSVGRALVDQLLQELDAIGSDNRDLLVLAATNAPWDVDEALKRPGRFDRMLFVPPPDEPARRRIVELQLAGRPVQNVDAKRIAKETALFSGADLRALVDRAVDEVIEEAIDTGGDPPLTQRHLDAAARAIRPSTTEWLATARNYVEFANEGGRYDDVEKFLRSREAKRAT